MLTVVLYNGDSGQQLAEVGVHPGSVGHRRCGVSFNPSDDRRVTLLKGLSAGLMQAIADEMLALDPGDADGKRCMATAMTHLEAAQMFAVKGLFAKPAPG